MKPNNKRSILFLILFSLLANPISAQDGGLSIPMPLLIFGFVKNSDGSFPQSPTIIMKNTVSGEMIDLGTYGCHYSADRGVFAMQVANFPSAYNYGDGLILEITGEDGKKATWIGSVPMDRNQASKDIGTFTLSDTQAPIIESTTTLKPSSSSTLPTSTLKAESTSTITEKQGDTGSFCIQVITYAVDPENTECNAYPTPCDVPQGFRKVDSCPQIDSAEIGDDGRLVITPTGGETTLSAQSDTKPICSDGIQNQKESGVDCGGPCQACKNWFKGESGLYALVAVLVLVLVVIVLVIAYLSFSGKK
ncbi:MAG: hypothetical protein ABH950_02030 [Candidatus Altiarchaeota archaeon]